MHQQKKFRDAIFVITEERSCPIYNVSEELKVEDRCAVLPEAKSVCMVLVEKLIEITAKKESFQQLSQLGTKRSIFDCGGCQGFIKFEYKKKKGFSTLQMKLLSEAEELRRKKHLDKFFSKLRNFQLLDRKSVVVGKECRL